MTDCGGWWPLPGKGRKGGRPRKNVNLEAAFALRKAGMSFRYIAKQLHVGLGTVVKALKDTENSRNR